MPPASPKRRDDGGPAASAIRDILAYLIERHGAQVGINSDTLVHHAGRVGLSARTVKRWQREAVAKINVPSRTKLVKLFKPALPHLTEDMFTAKNAFEFADKLQRHPTFDVHVLLPSDRQVISRESLAFATDQLKGIWLLYRYSFDDTGTICQEVIDVKRDDNRLTFSFHFRVNSSEQGGQLLKAFGEVLPIGDSYLMLSLEAAPNPERSRARTLLLRRTEPHYIFGQYRFGLLQSISPYTREPCAARILMRRAEVTRPADMAQFIKQHARFMKDAELDSVFPQARADRVREILSNKLGEPGGKHILTTNTNIFNARMFAESAERGPGD